MTGKKLSAEQREELLNVLETRFNDNMHRHAGLEWSDIQKKLDNKEEKYWALYQMEETGGEPDVIGYDKEKDIYIVCDCSAESPVGRRSVCYDVAALESHKKNKPADSACGMAEDMGIELLNEEQYRSLQEIENVDKKTSSWIQTPETIRKLGGALFCDYRYATVFVYHNGAESYYGARGFRGFILV